MAKIYMFGIIENSEWDDSVSAKSIAKQLGTIPEDEEVIVYINSPGGDVFEGHAIYNLLAELKDRLTIKIIGQASSIASEISCAAGEGKTLIADNAMMLLHYPWTFGIIDEQYLEKLQTELKAVKESIYSSYIKKTNLTKNKLDDLLSKNTYHDAKTCVKLGFADKVWNPAEDEVAIIEESKEINNRVMQQFAQRTFQNLTKLNESENLNRWSPSGRWTPSEKLDITIDKNLIDSFNKGGHNMSDKNDGQNSPQSSDQGEIKNLLTKVDKLEARNEDMAKQNDNLKNQVEAMTLENAEWKNKYSAIEAELKKMQDKMIVKEVDADLNNLVAAKKITPKEITDEGIMLNIGGQKITRDQLLNLKRNEEVVSHLIGQVKARAEMGGMNAVLPEIPAEEEKKAVSGIKDFKDFAKKVMALGSEWDYDKECTAYIEKYASENNMTFENATDVLITKIEEGE